MYLLYDVIQHRIAAVGNSLLVKRKDYGAVQDVMSSLTHDQLIAAAQSLRVSHKISDPAIAVLRRYIQTITGRIPNSFAQKFNMRLHIRALFIEFGFPAFWLTINPSGPPRSSCEGQLPENNHGFTQKDCNRDPDRSGCVFL